MDLSGTFRVTKPYRRHHRNDHPSITGTVKLLQSTPSLYTSALDTSRSHWPFLCSIHGRVFRDLEAGLGKVILVSITHGIGSPLGEDLLLGKSGL